MINTRWNSRKRSRLPIRYLRLLIFLAVFTFFLDMFHARRCWTTTITKDSRRPSKLYRQIKTKALDGSLGNGDHHQYSDERQTQPKGGEGDEEDHTERIFIASTHWNSEAVLRSHWNAAIVELVQSLGANKVYVSIYESGSWDDTKGALRDLNATLAHLGIPCTVTLSEATHQDEISQPPASNGWIDTARGRRELRRIPFLSEQRNRSLQPMFDMENVGGEYFDKILFLNDVVFRTNDFYTLLNTREGEYAAACALDFSKPPKFYDTFALRDSEGHEPLMETWPYFRSRVSRSFLEHGEPTPVSSCWNGMVIMDASPFYSPSDPLRFRGIPDSLASTHLEASECCLIHADNGLSTKKGVWLNPRVRVGYSVEAYESVHPGVSLSPSSSFLSPSSSSSKNGPGEKVTEENNGGGEGEEGPWISATQVFLGIWSNRFRRWFTTDALKMSVVRHRLEGWKERVRSSLSPGQGPAGTGASATAHGENSQLKDRYIGFETDDEKGEFCLINEMQVLVANGWAHV